MACTEAYSRGVWQPASAKDIVKACGNSQTGQPWACTNMAHALHDAYQCIPIAMIKLASDGHVKTWLVLEHSKSLGDG